MKKAVVVWMLVAITISLAFVVNKPMYTSIVIQPYENVSQEYIKYLDSGIRKVYPVVEIGLPRKLPKKAEHKGRYCADTLLIDLYRYSNNKDYLGVTEKDIFSEKNGNPYWGIFGLGNCPGRSCVISPYRLAKGKKKEQLLTTAYHELGHTFGLDHCPTLYCIMEDAKGKNTMQKEKDFCPKCKSYLVSKGWTLK